MNSRSQGSARGKCMTIRILIVDDHSVVRQGLQMFLQLDPELEVVGEGRNGVEAVEQTQKSELRSSIKAAAAGQVQLSPQAAARLIREERKQEAAPEVNDFIE